MALHWDFKEKAGTVTLKQNGKDITLNWYEGNATMIVLNEWTEDNGEEMWSMAWFFASDDHAKNCLGLARGETNMFGKDAITSLTVYRDHCRGWEKLVKMFAKAFPDIEIRVLAKEPQEAQKTEVQAS